MEDTTATKKPVRPSPARFQALRDRYLRADAALSALRSTFTAKYSGAYDRTWLLKGERDREDRAVAAVDRAGAAFFAYLQSISPRDWSTGVPAHWLCEKLSYDDAVRPRGEPLSVVPPLSYGATRPVR
jgi:hypothetical protein